MYEKAQQRTVGCVKRQAGTAITFSPRAQTPVNIDHSDESAGMYLCHARGARLHASMRNANNVGWWHAVVHTTQARRRQQLAKKAIIRGVNLAGSSETIRRISCTCCPSRSSSDGWRSIRSVAASRHAIGGGWLVCMCNVHAFSVILGCWERACDARSSAQITSYGASRPRRRVRGPSVSYDTSAGT